MNLFRRHPLFSTLLAILLLAIAAEAWYFQRGRSQERALEEDLRFKIAEIERLQRQRPGPTEENLRRVREDFAQNAEVLRTMLRSLNVVGPDELEYFKGEPAGRTEAFFDIAQFVDAMRAQATKAEVTIRPDERFGFSAYANEGPDGELIQPVYRQRRIGEYLLGALFAARPRSLLNVQREDPQVIVQKAAQAKAQAQGAATGAAAGGANAPARAAPTPTGAGGGTGSGDSATASDIFVIDPQVSARTPGYVDTMAFRIVFTGHTTSLRGFLNALAVPEIPLVVRSVEVEPARGDAASATDNRPGNRRPPASTTAAGDKPGQPAASSLAIVADNESRFTVTIELFEVQIRAPEVEAEAGR